MSDEREPKGWVFDGSRGEFWFIIILLVSAWGAHPSPVQGYYSRDNAYFQQYHERSKTQNDFYHWAERWVYGVPNRADYTNLLGTSRLEALEVKKHAYAAPTDFGY